MGVVIAGIVVMLLVAAIALYLVFVRFKTPTSAVSSSLPPSHHSPSSPLGYFKEPTNSQERNMTPTDEALVIYTRKAAGRMLRAKGLVSLSIPTPSLAPEDVDLDSDSEHIGGWRGGTESAGGPVFVLEAPTEPELHSRADIEMAEISVVEPNPDSKVYIHD